MANRIEHLKAVEEILGCEIPCGSSAEGIIYDDADSNEPAQMTAYAVIAKLLRASCAATQEQTQ